MMLFAMITLIKCALFLKFCVNNQYHDDVIKWKHLPRSWPFVWGIHRLPVNSLHKGQWRGALMFSLICVWINGWVNNLEACDLRRYRAHYDVTVMLFLQCIRVNDVYSQIEWYHVSCTGLVLGLRPANERRCYFVTTSPIDRVQALNQPYCTSCTSHIICGM